MNLFGNLYLGYQTHLIHVIFARKQWLAIHQLQENAPNRPHINCCGVVSGIQEQLWGPVPPCNHVLRHDVIL